MSRTIFSDPDAKNVPEHAAFVGHIAADIEDNIHASVLYKNGVQPDQLQSEVSRYLEAAYPGSDVGTVLIKLYQSWEYGSKMSGKGAKYIETMEPQEFAGVLVMLGMRIAEGVGVNAYQAALDTFMLWLSDAQAAAGMVQADA